MTPEAQPPPRYLAALTEVMHLMARKAKAEAHTAVSELSEGERALALMVCMDTMDLLEERWPAPDAPASPASADANTEAVNRALTSILDNMIKYAMKFDGQDLEPAWLACSTQLNASPAQRDDLAAGLAAFALTTRRIAGYRHEPGS